ncbi:MAG: hypothetical protein M3380_10940 [Chloroflexota bacterium]|nr:hypothetical protein [Chloroflexota bacterium]
MTEDKLRLGKPPLRIAAKEEDAGTRRHQVVVNLKNAAMVPEKTFNALRLIRSDKSTSGLGLVYMTRDKLEVQISDARS